MGGCSSKNHPLQSTTITVQDEVHSFGIIIEPSIESFLNNRLLKISLAKKATVIVLNDMQPRAFSSDHEIIITKGLLLHMKSASALDLILAHELGHIVLHHFDQTLSRIKKEEAADAFAASILASSGSLCFDSLLLFEEPGLIFEIPNSNTDDAYPSTKERLRLFASHSTHCQKNFNEELEFQKIKELL